LYEFFSQPSGLSDQAENRENLPAGYYPRLLAGKTEDWIRVYVHGEYGFLRDGKPIYPEYSDAVHCAREELQPVPGLPIRVGLDFGLTPAAAIGQRLANGRWIFFGELVTDDMGIERFAQRLAPLLAQWQKWEFIVHGDPAGEQRAQADERTRSGILRAHRIAA